MATLGEFRTSGLADIAKRVFHVAGSELEVAESSVSSEWTTESEGEAADLSIPKGKRKRIRMWRVKHSLAKHRHLRDDPGSSSSGDSSRSTSSSTDSSSESSSNEKGEIDVDNYRSPRTREKEKPTRPKGRSRNDRRLASKVIEVPVKRDHPPSVNSRDSAPLQWARCGKQYRDLGFALGFLNPDEVVMLSQAAHHPSVKEIHDRKAYLAFKHRVVRFEMQLRAMFPALYARLMALMRMADSEGWKRLRKRKSKVYPEIEYIEYDVDREGGECYIEPHVDNKSGITLVAMLTPQSDYVGGRSCFRRAQGVEGHRQVSLELGDAVLFRGEKLLHWITNVTGGRRIILQIELSRV